MVLTDLERHCVVAVLEERSQKFLEDWLSKLSEAERKAIRLVGMDMWGPYGRDPSQTIPCRDRGRPFSCDEATQQCHCEDPLQFTSQS